MTDFINCKVCVKLINSEELEGVVTSVERDNKRISLDKVVTSKGVHLPGLQHFYGHEVADVTILDNKKAISSDHSLSNKWKKGSKLLIRKRIPHHLTRLHNYSQEPFLLKNLVSKVSGETLEENAQSSDYESSSDQDYSSHSKYCVLTKLNELFYKAITHISSQQLIAVAFEGVCLGRNGKLCWIQICTEEETFLFDIVKLGDSAIEDGLKSILENGEIQKIIHDCRLPSDFFEHQYSLRIVNIFDTQVAAAFVYRLFHHGNWPRFVPGLASCLLEHLPISPDQVNLLRIRENSKKADQGAWAQRPATPRVLEAAARNVVYLFELRSVLMEKMFAEFVAGVDVYLQHVRDASKDDAIKYQNSSHLLPMAFQQLSLIVTSRTNYIFDHRKNSKTSDNQRFLDNCQGIRDPELIYSKDSVWHTGFKKSKGNTLKFKSPEEKSAQQNRPIMLSNKMKTAGTTVDTHEGMKSKVTNRTEKTTGLLKPVLSRSSETSSPEKQSHKTTLNVDNNDFSVSKCRTVNDVIKIQHVTENYDGEDDRSVKGVSIIDVDKHSYGEEEKTGNQLTGTKLMRRLIEQNNGYSSTKFDSDKLKDFVILPAGYFTGNLKKRKMEMQPVKPTHRRSEGDYRSSEQQKEKGKVRRCSSGDSLIKTVSEIEVVDVSPLEKLYVDAPQSHSFGLHQSENVSETHEPEFAMGKKGENVVLQNRSLYKNVFPLYGYHTKRDNLPIPSVKDESIYFENASPMGTHIRIHSYERKEDFSVEEHSFSPTKEQCDTNSSGTSSYLSVRSCSPSSRPSKKVQNGLSGSVACSEQLKSSLLGKLVRSPAQSMVYTSHFSTPPSSTEKTPQVKGSPSEISSSPSSQLKSSKEINLLQMLFEVLGMKI